jgi:pimeloyl-ACP methyl ester carboxylesterase
VLPSRLSRDIGLRTQVNAGRVAEQDLEFYLGQMARMSPELFLDLLEEAHRHTAIDHLDAVDVPTLVVAGARDSFVPLPTLRELAFAIPGARWRVLDEATHALPAEFPAEVAAAILELAGET